MAASLGVASIAGGNHGEAMFRYFEEMVYWYGEGLRRGLDFNGRDCRKVYWMFTLGNTLINLILFYGERLLGTAVPLLGAMHPVSRIYSALIFVPCSAIMVRRLHDTGRSGWWAVLFLVPGAMGLAAYFIDRIHGFDLALLVLALLVFVSFLMVLLTQIVFLTRDSQRGSNRYGPQPKAF
jgi:uncharacterized membrane protein YhaH (DUF805 family)